MVDFAKFIKNFALNKSLFFDALFTDADSVLNWSMTSDISVEFTEVDFLLGERTL